MKFIFATIIAVFSFNTNFATVGETYKTMAIEQTEDTLFALTDQVFPDTLSIAGAIDSVTATDSLEINGEMENPEPEEETHWERGEPNYLFFILPIVLVGIVILVLKWKKKES